MIPFRRPLILVACFSLVFAAFACSAKDTGRGTTRETAANTTVSGETAAAAEISAEPGADETATSFFDFKTRTLEGEPADLGAYRGQVVLAVNVASKCGFTPQYEGLEALQRELAPRGFTVLGFPSNDFKNQEPGTPEEIREFCTATYGVTFPLFEKMRVTGDDKSAIYRFLTTDSPEPDWNFTKYLIDRNGRVVQRFGPRTTPDDAELRGRILALLDEQG
jgi:glutathione peroxidase